MGEMSFGMIMMGLLFGSLGLGYFMYGKKQDDWYALGAGLVMMVIPYFILNLWLLLLAGMLLAAVPFAANRWL